MSKGKKQAFTLLGLCVLVAAAICLYFFVPKGDTKDEASQDTSTEATVHVTDIDTSKISSIDISGTERDDLSLKKDGDKWTLADSPEIPLDSSAVEAIYEKISSVTATKEMDADESQYSEYGLDKPQMTVKIGTSDGEEYVLKFGETVPVSGGNYGLFNDSKKVYTFADTLCTAFQIEKNSLISKEEVAEINSQYLTHIHVKKDGEDTFYADIVPDAKKVDAYTNWVISKPYKRLLAGSSTDDWTTMEGYFTSVTLGDLVDYNCKDMSKYGLSSPKTTVDVGYFAVKDGYEIPTATTDPNASSTKTNGDNNKASQVPEKYRENKGYVLNVGKKNSDGDYYVNLKGSKNVYTMKAETVDNMIGVDAYKYMDHCIYSTLATDIKGYDATIGDTKISVTRSTKKGDDGKDKNVWTMNGTTISDDNEEAFLTPYSKQYLLEFSSAAKDSVKPKSNKPVMTIVFHEESRDVTVKYLPYDGTNFYRVDKDGMDYFLVDKRSVDDTVTAFKSLLELK